MAPWSIHKHMEHSSRCYILFSACLNHADRSACVIGMKVLVHGSAEATEHLKQHCSRHVCPHVYAPQIQETIDVTSDLCAYKVLTNLIFFIGKCIGWASALFSVCEHILTYWAFLCDCRFSFQRS